MGVLDDLVVIGTDIVVLLGFDDLLDAGDYVELLLDNTGRVETGREN